MRNRISHFTVKDIEINVKTRPEPKNLEKNSKEENLDRKNKSVGNRRNLANKLGLTDKAKALGLKISSRFSRKVTRKPASITRPALERKSVKKESEYARKPEVLKSKILQQIVLLEAEVFRSLSYNGYREVEVGNPGGRGKDPQIF